MSEFSEALAIAREVDPTTDEAMFWHDLFLGGFSARYGYEAFEDRDSKFHNLRTVLRTSGACVQAAIVKSERTYPEVQRINLALAAFEFAFKILDAVEVSAEHRKHIVENAMRVVSQ